MVRQKGEGAALKTGVAARFWFTRKVDNLRPFPWTQVRKDKADARRAIVLTLAEQIIALLRESGAKEEEAQAALDCARIMVPLQELDNVDGSMYLG